MLRLCRDDKDTSKDTFVKVRFCNNADGNILIFYDHLLICMLDKKTGKFHFNELSRHEMDFLRIKGIGTHCVKHINTDTKKIH